MTRATKGQEAQRKRYATSKNKKFRKIVKAIDERDKDPTDNTSDRAILRDAGYSDQTKAIEVLGSPSYLKVRTEYYKNHKDYKHVERQLEAKARRNLDEGLDSKVPREKLEWTKLQLKQEEVVANRVKLEIKDTNGNLLTLFGLQANDDEMIMPATAITEIKPEKDED